jgi:hypothetical protein
MSRKILQRVLQTQSCIWKNYRNCNSKEGDYKSNHNGKAKEFRRKVVIDVPNPMDFSKGMPLTPVIAHPNSAANCAAHGVRRMSSQGL